MPDVNAELDKLEKLEELRSGAKFFKFAEVGDSIQGTLVTSFKAESTLGQSQIVYVLKNDEGVWNVGFKEGYPIHRDLEKAVAGQVVRFSFTGTKPHKQKGYHPIKLMAVVTRPDLMDTASEQWLSDYGIIYGAPLPTSSEGTSTDIQVGSEEEEEGEEESSSRPLSGGLPRA